MERLGSKLKQKLKLSDSGSVKFSKKKNDLANANNSNGNNANNGTLAQNSAPVSTPQFPLSCSTSVEVCGQSAGRPSRESSQRIAPSNTTSTTVPEDCGPGIEHHPPSLAPLRRRSPQQRASCYLPEAVEWGQLAQRWRWPTGGVQPEFSRGLEAAALFSGTPAARSPPAASCPASSAVVRSTSVPNTQLGSPFIHCRAQLPPWFRAPQALVSARSSVLQAFELRWRTLGQRAPCFPLAPPAEDPWQRHRGLLLSPCTSIEPLLLF